MSAIEQVFAKTKIKFRNVDEMEQLLIEEGIALKEAKQAISLARAKRIIHACHSHTDEIRRDRCHELPRKEDREFDRVIGGTPEGDDRRNPKEKITSHLLRYKPQETTAQLL